MAEADVKSTWVDDFFFGENDRAIRFNWSSFG
jgi:hypothetical protein